MEEEEHYTTNNDNEPEWASETPEHSEPDKDWAEMMQGENWPDDDHNL